MKRLAYWLHIEPPKTYIYTKTDSETKELFIMKNDFPSEGVKFF